MTKLIDVNEILTSINLVISVLVDLQLDRPAIDSE